MKEYYVGAGDYWGNNNVSKKFNENIVPRLLAFGIKESDMDEVAKMFEDLCEMSYENGANNTECALNEG